MEEFYDEVDYTQANAAESRRCERTEEMIRTAKYSRDKVRTGFITDEEYREFKGQDIVFDVLPSFDMYQSVQNRSEFIPISHPPDYFDSSTSSPSSPSLNASTTSSVSAPHSGISVSAYSTASTPSGNVFSPLGTTVRNVVDNVHKLPLMPAHPFVTVEIHVTKSAPQPLERPEAENMLKEYTSGDAVHGYVIISNRSSKPVPFHMFNITLEGVTSVANPAARKMHNMRFLKMIDMNASWTFGWVSPSTNIRYKSGMKDWDGCILGLNARSVLEPKTNYKKFFFFKVPYTLLDNTCPHQQEIHTLLPPSFGIDRYTNSRELSTITVNSALHYGHNGTRGSPILTKDLSNDNLSVSYSVNAVLIGSHPTLRDDTGQPELSVMRSEQYALRFIPFGFSVSLFSSRRALDTLKEVIQSSFNNAERLLKLNEEGSEEEVKKLDHDIKMKQLHIGACIKHNDEESVQSLPLRNEKAAAPDFSKIETTMAYVAEQKKTLFGKAKQLSESGLIRISAHVPEYGLPYVSPPLIRKVNEVSKLNELGMKNIDTLTKTLSMNEKKKLTDLEFQVNFNPSYMSSFQQHPEIAQITSSLLAVNIYSKRAIPIKFSSDILLGQGDGLQEIRYEFEKYSETFEQLKCRFAEKGFNIDRCVDKYIQEDITAMKEMKSDMFELPVLKNKVVYYGQWHKENGEWVKDIKLSLDYHDNITETLVPNFQACLFSRIYCIQVNFKFEKCSQITSIRVPVRLRWFDNDK
jgi:hypothetical protein